LQRLKFPAYKTLPLRFSSRISSSLIRKPQTVVLWDIWMQLESRLVLRRFVMDKYVVLLWDYVIVLYYLFSELCLTMLTVAQATRISSSARKKCNNEINSLSAHALLKVPSRQKFYEFDEDHRRLATERLYPSKVWNEACLPYTKQKHYYLSPISLLW
jgi:hypothetical protein